MKRLYALPILAVLILLVCCILPTKAEAAISGYYTYTYTVSNGEATITDCSTSISGNVTIPSTLGGYPVTSIGSSAFDYCENLESIAIPDSVTSIGSFAFQNCTSLTSITVPDSVTSIGGYAFYCCWSLTRVNFGDNSQLTSIGGYAFYCCESLTSVAIPGSVTSIGEGAFSGCNSLTEILVADGNLHYISDTQGVLFNKDKTQLIQAPGGLSDTYTIPDGVTSIGSLAFSYCSLTSITVPDSVTSIGDEAFEYCFNLTSVTFGEDSQLTSIGSYAFDCCSLIGITIPDSVISIGDGAFCDCSSLTNVIFGENSQLTSIGEGAFFLCESLSCITFPDSVTSIGDEAFENCYNLISVTIPESVTGIGDYAFDYCDSLNHVAYAGTQAQWAEVTVGVDNEALTEATYFHYETVFDCVETCTQSSIYCPVCQVNISQTEKPDGAHTFAEATCTEPKTCTACSVTEGEPLGHSFAEATYTAPKTCTVCGMTEGEPLPSLFTYSLSDGMATITGLVNPLVGDVVIPSVIDGYPVTGIGASAFAGCSGLTGITVPDSVTSIGEGAFSGCSSLESITVPFVGGSRKKATETYQYPFGYIFGTTGYTGGVATRQYYYGSTIASTTDSTYYVPSSLKYVTVTGGNILFGAFYACSGLTSITIPENITGIGYRAFFGCSGLTSMVIPDSITSIGNHAFRNCTKLNGITIPGGVTSIGNSAFLNCSSLNHVAYAGTQTQWAEVTVGTNNGALTGAANFHYETVFAYVESCVATSVYCPVCQELVVQEERSAHTYEDGVCTRCGENGQHSLVLTKDTQVDWSLIRDMYIDLNGFDLSGTIITNGFKIFGMDSTTDSYSCDSIGYFTCVDENGDFIVPERIYTNGEKQYMAICEEDRYSFHRFFVGITHMTLAPETVGLGYKAAIFGDEMVMTQLAATKAFSFRVQLEGYNPVYRYFDSDELASGDPITLRIRNYDVENYSEHNLYAQVSLTLNDGTVIEAEQVSLTFRWLTEQVNAKYTDYTNEQITQFKAMLQQFDIVRKWDIPNLI